ncbi:MAG: MFS transporter [Cytophagaceae bacterium]
MTTTHFSWRQISSLAALNAAIVISWIAYHNYQPKLLEKFGSQDLSFFLIVAQSLILVIIPPIAGKVADIMISKNSNYFVVFTIGVSVTAMIFMSVAFSLQTVPFSIVKTLLPFLLVLWLISMNIFHSPANSMLELFASKEQLPIAMALITLITELIYSIEPIVIYIIEFFGASLTFLTGGILIILTGYFFRKNAGDAVFKRETSESSNRTNYLLVLISGLVFGLALSVIMNVLPEKVGQNQLLNNQFSNPQFFVSVVLAISALLAFPISFRVRRLGVRVSLITGAILAILGGLIIINIDMPIVFYTGCIVFSLAFSIISVSAFPFALSNLSHSKVTYGTGLFFGMSELPNGLFNLLSSL